jgi:phosphoglycerate dehydrogenase-like enzyme
MAKAMVNLNADTFRIHFDDATLARLKKLCFLVGPVPCGDLMSLGREQLEDVEILVTGWRTRPIDAQVLTALPRLRLVVHMAGSVRALLPPQIFERGVRVTNAADPNAKPVAEFTLAMILLANKRVFDWMRIYRAERKDFDSSRKHGDPAIGNFRKTIGIVGASRIGRAIIGMLRQHDCRVLLAHPGYRPQEAQALGATLVDLPELLGASDIVSLHQPLIPETRGSFGATELAAMRDGAVLINTARGAIVDHAALTRELGSGRIGAILDVTDPYEPLPNDSPLWDLPNVVLTPHIAGSMGNEVTRMTESMLDEIERFNSGKALLHELTPAKWARYA